MSYSIPTSPCERLFEEKKSKFYAYAAKAESRASAIAAVNTCKMKYPDARHHCWAYLLGSPHKPISVAMNDDGEPSGTAGKPMLNVLQHGEVGNVVVVISRYFGGIKLGAGGLIRAYSNATNLVLSSLDTQVLVEAIETQCHVSFGDEQKVRHWLLLHQGTVIDATYSAHVSLSVRFPTSYAEPYKKFITALTGDQSPS
ncbi:IMPACT family protein [Agaribacter flavus]|uniref:IMPACT family protein n=1 Tax=Agaribacter flavus TaxID=1902781 RepID=A0ABV7FUQ3_9ALTE